MRRNLGHAAIPWSGRPHFCGAFTLFEVAISLLILAVAITAMALAYPVGIKAQQLARFKLYAGTKVLEIADTFANHNHMFFDRQIEGKRLGQCTFANAVPTDLDRMMCLPVLGLLPLPDALALRLDSDDDEIAKIIENGGRLYFSSPHAFETGSQILANGNIVMKDIPTEAQSLLFAVVGYAQQNALPNHPCLAWPYFAFYPTPAQPWEKDSWDIWEAGGLLPSGSKAKFDALYAEYNATNRYGPSTSDNAQLVAWMKLAQNLLVAVMPAASVDSTTSPEGPFASDPLPLPVSGNWDRSDLRSFPKPWQVLAIRYLANIATSRTGKGAPALSGTQKTDMERYSQACHAAMVKWTMRYASTSPYDWGAPRPLNRQNAFDFPLLQFDLFPTATAPAPFPVGDGTDDVTWKVIAPIQPTDYGRARGKYGYPENPLFDMADNHRDIDGSWGNFAHFNVTKPFAAAERDRQVVCFAVDWRAYEDFEELPSGPYDATCYNYDSRGSVVAYERAIYPPDTYQFWFDATRSSLHEWTGAPVTSRDASPADPGYLGDASESIAFKSRHLGVFGSDRNGNKVFDRGPVPKSVRMRAVTVCRYNYYDRRIVCSLRY